MTLPKDTATATVWVVANAQAWGCQRDPEALTRVVRALQTAGWEPQVIWTTNADEGRPAHETPPRRGSPWSWPPEAMAR